MTVTIYIWRAGRNDLGAHDTAFLHSFEDAQPALYDLPAGWSVEQNAAGKDMIFTDKQKGCDLVVQGPSVAAVSEDGIVWLRKTGSHQGDALRLAREYTGMSMRQLAEKSGVSVNTVSLIEAGKSAPRADILKALADALGTTMDAIW